LDDISWQRKTVDGGWQIIHVPKEEWDTLIPGAHAGYVSWEDYEQINGDSRKARRRWEGIAVRARLEKDRRCCRD
jgi:hypothetical protein